MEDVLKRLLDTEARAEAIIAAAEADRQARVDTALAEVRDAEARFRDQVAALREPILREAEARAEQLAADLARRYQARQRRLRDLADRNEATAVQAALALLLDPHA